MTSRSGVPELIAGTIVSYFLWWLGPTMIHMQLMVTTLYTADSPETTALILSAAYGALLVGLGLVFAGYCYAVLLERVVYWGYERYLKWRKVIL